MATVVIAPTAIADLDRLIATHSLPRDTRARVKALLRPLAEFPRMGPALSGRWTGFRFLLGPWSWMLLVYSFDEDTNQVTVVTVVTVQDARTATSATSGS